MAKNQFAQPHFHDENAARQWFEAARWPNGPICPKCGATKHYATKKLGRYRCGAPTCRKDFTVHDRHGDGAQPRQAHSVGRRVPSGRLPARKASRRTSYIASSAASTTPLGSCIIASWKRCAVAVSICRRWVVKARWSKPTKPISAICRKRNAPSSQRSRAAVLKRSKYGAGQSAPSSPSWSAAVKSAHSMFRATPGTVVDIVRKTSPAKRGCIPMKASFTSRRQGICGT